MSLIIKTPRGNIEVVTPAAFLQRFGVSAPPVLHGARLAALRFSVGDASLLKAAPEEAGIAGLYAEDATVIGPKTQWVLFWYLNPPVDRKGAPASWSRARSNILDKALLPNSIVNIGAVRFGNDLPLAVIAGPCVLESKAHALEMATALKEIAGKVGIGLVYKTSFDKANRTSAKSARGIGIDQALQIFSEIREKLKVPILTDVHEAEQCAHVAAGRRRYCKFPPFYAGRPTFSSPRQRPARRST